MTCTFEEDLTAYVDAELPAPRRAALDAHLPGCMGCRATLVLLERTVSVLRQVPAHEPAPQRVQAMRRELLARLDAPPTGVEGVLERLRAAWRPGMWVPAAGLLGAALVAVVLARPHRALEPTDPGQLELAANMELVEDYEVLGVASPEDADVVQNLRDLEGTP